MKDSVRSRWVPLLCRLALAGIFGLAAFGKVYSFDPSRVQLHDSGLVSASNSAYILGAFVALEFLTAITLLAVPRSAIARALLTTAMAFLFGYRATQGLVMEERCRCFGIFSLPGWGRDVILVGMLLAYAGVWLQTMKEPKAPWLARLLSRPALVGAVAIALAIASGVVLRPSPQPVPEGPGPEAPMQRPTPIWAFRTIEDQYEIYDLTVITAGQEGEDIIALPSCHCVSVRRNPRDPGGPGMWKYEVKLDLDDPDLAAGTIEPAVEVTVGLQREFFPVPRGS